jgi:hypothetical protein
MTDSKTAKYSKEKNDFLDSLQPDDFRNGGSFNQAEQIIDQLNQALYSANKNSNAENFDRKKAEEYINKAASHLFREGSPAVKKTVDLALSFLEMKF